jgi:DNA-binding MarR family transcriptional regulator
VQKSACKADKRLVDITLTQNGLALVQKLDQFNDQIDAILKGVTENEAATLNQILDKLRSLPEHP